jgi:hypothetical protein
MVAGADLQGSLRPRVAAALLVSLLLGIGLCAALKDRTNLHRIARPAKPPEALTEDARRVLEKLGWEGVPGDSASSFCYDLSYVAYQRR